MAARTTRAAFFLIGGVAVVVVLALLIFTRPERGQMAAEPSPVADDAHSEIAWMEQMWKEHPTHAPIALQLGNLYAAQGNHPAAVQYYREFLKLDTSATGWQVRLDVAKSLHAMGKPDAAKSELQWILQREPNHAGALYNMGALEANTGHPARAREYWDRLISAHPQDTLARFARQSLTQLE